jgi:uncharacterized phage protein gp47/JayE
MTPSLTGCIATIGAAGPVVPSIDAIVGILQQFFYSIYGSDIYIENDSQDGQFLGLLANAFNDLNAAVVSTYNCFSPSTAQGTGLSSVIKINGIAREAATNSTAVLTLTGTAGQTTIIINGQVGDGSQNIWQLPSPVSIPPSGTLAETATCQTIGAVLGLPGAISSILTPQRGWLGATNANAATVGAPVEKDDALRNRQAISTELAALTVTQGIVGAVANLPGVQAVTAFENDTATTNAQGIPAYSLALVVAGGDAQTIGNTIFASKAGGSPTYGNTAVIVITQSVPVIVYYSVPTQETITVAIALSAGQEYTDEVAAEIQNAVATFISAYPSGARISWSKVLAQATLPGNPDGASFDITLLTLALGGGPPVSADIPLTFAQEAVCGPSNVVITT